MYYQTQNGDDFAFRVNSGIAIDAKWTNCSLTASGSEKLGIMPGAGYRTLGTDFYMTTCLKIMYRGYTTTGSFTGTTRWDENWI